MSVAVAWQLGNFHRDQERLRDTVAEPRSLFACSEAGALIKYNINDAEIERFNDARRW